VYRVNPSSPEAYARHHHEQSGEALVKSALAYLQTVLAAPGATLNSPQAVKDYLILELGRLEHEEFGVLFLTAQHAVIAYESMFRGTLTQTSVYPREVIKAALRHNAAAVIFAHNHPSGNADPSRADEHLTQTLKSALALVDVRALDHIIVGNTSTVSFAERGLL
jgi:DNA repair protein RadC